MAERMMKELFVEGLQKGKWQYFKDVLKFAIAKMATSETDSTEALDIWAENNNFNKFDEDFDECYDYEFVENEAVDKFTEYFTQTFKR